MEQITDSVAPTDEIEALLQADATPPPIIGPKGEELPAIETVLGIEKFKKHGDKHYRLIWVNNGHAWLAQEDTTPFRRHSEAAEAGRLLARKHAAKKFSEVTR